MGVRGGYMLFRRGEGFKAEETGRDWWIEVEVVEEEEVIETERWCPPPCLEVECGGDGASPKMKYFMNAPIKIATVSWPRRKP